MRKRKVARPKGEEEQWLTIICRLLPSSTDKEIEVKRGLPPGEIVVVPMHATIGDLKKAAESALRDTSFITEWFVVIGIEGLDEMEDMEVLFGVVESGAGVGVSGSGIDLDTPLRYEGGSDTWMVRCECGARDDDGELKRLSAIAAEMGQLKNEIEERRRALNLFLRNVRARDPAEAEERIGAAREGIRERQRRLQVLQEEQQALIVRAVTLGDRENH
ncbi:hypothetical protein L3X38_000197 (mitochondrion) [Prunus dulcis]|uniref:PHD finger protein MALE STERILITY 1-like ubiquitin-like domain-containing protein n=1 Tax=Prunus dulcis TaxID=3755 RepID=A0AAD4UST8_PRUDU|nr:hypothetical protein L3X38_000197 [Prunus dulcis]